MLARKEHGDLAFADQLNRWPVVSSQASDSPSRLDFPIGNTGIIIILKQRREDWGGCRKELWEGTEWTHLSRAPRTGPGA